VTYAAFDMEFESDSANFFRRSKAIRVISLARSSVAASA
jgi:hypothetical protein